MNYTTPTLLLDTQKVRKNIRRIHQKTLQSNVVFRPHYKTHQSKKIGNMFKEEGIGQITVSSVGMADYFAGDWDEITIAVPFNRHEINEVNQLLQKQALVLMTDSVETTRFLSEHLAAEVAMWIEIDTGDKRTGIDPGNTNLIRQIIEIIKTSDFLSLKGFYSHAGHSYSMKGRQEKVELYHECISKMDMLKNQFEPDEPGLEVNFGDTPCISSVDDLAAIDSTSAGNLVFYDMTQTEIGSCEPENVAVCLACPIISKNKERQEVVVYGGGIHLSKDRTDNFGAVVMLDNHYWSKPLDGCFVRKISQEHGVISLSKEVWDSLEIGDFIGILPIHSCMTAECMGRYFDFEGNVYDHYSELNNR